MFIFGGGDQGLERPMVFANVAQSEWLSRDPNSLVLSLRFLLIPR